MIEGFFRAHFANETDHGEGVAYLRDGEIHGGDSAMYYRGTYRMDGDDFEADIEVGRHTDDSVIVSITGAEFARHKIVGKRNGEGLICKATTDQAPGKELTLSLSPIR